MASKERPNGYWNNYENCFEEASKYDSRAAFQRGCMSAYTAARKNGWLKYYTWFKRPEAHNKKWNYDTCKEEALKFRTKVEFAKGSSGAYDAARANGWLKDFVFDEIKKPNGYWTYERCKEEAVKYKTKTGLQKGNSSAYNAALENGWLNDFDFEEKEKPKGYWKNYEHCKEEALKYKTKSDFKRGCYRAYIVSLEQGWIDDFGFEKGVDRGEVYWVYVYEDVENKAVYVGLTFRKERHREHKTDETDTVRLYFESINKPVPEPRIKMDGLNAEDALHYEDWYKQKYAEAGWKVLNRAKTGVGSGSLGNAILKWDYEHCKEEAKKYKTKNQFKKGSQSAYQATRINGWLNEFFPKAA